MESTLDGIYPSAPSHHNQLTQEILKHLGQSAILTEFAYGGLNLKEFIYMSALSGNHTHW
jgi:hypothetical protein